MRMMGVRSAICSSTRAEYAEVLDKLIIGSAGQIQPNAVTKTIAGGRVAYLTGCVGGEEIESELRACKLRYAVIENPAELTCARSEEHTSELQSPDHLPCPLPL